MSTAAGPSYKPLAPRESAVYLLALAWLATAIHLVVRLRDADGALTQFESDKTESARQTFVLAVDAIKWSTYLEVGVTLLLGLAVIRWQARVYDNVLAFQRQPAFSRSKSLWSWFVPVAALAWPLYSLRDLWHLSDAEAPVTDAAAQKAPLPMKFWWAAWLGYTIGMNPVLSNFGDVKTPEAFHDLVNKMVWGMGAGLVAGMLLIHVVRSFRPRQDACASQLFGPGATAVRGARTVGDHHEPGPDAAG